MSVGLGIACDGSSCWENAFSLRFPPINLHSVFATMHPHQLKYAIVPYCGISKLLIMCTIAGDRLHITAFVFRDHGGVLQFLGRNKTEVSKSPFEASEESN